MSATETYRPSRSLPARLLRRSAYMVARQTVRPKLERGLVSLSFDDCPRSVVEYALPMLEREGWRGTIYACVGLCDTVNHLGLHMSEDDLVIANSRGHEIADHTYSHVDVAQIGAEATLEDIARNRAAFDRLGLPRASTFAYPYGEVTPGVKRRLSAEFALSRGIRNPGGPAIDLNLAPSARLYEDTVEAVLSQIETAARRKSWLTLFTHDVRPSPSEFGCTPESFSRVLHAVREAGMDVLPVRDALASVKGAV